MNKIKLGYEIGTGKEVDVKSTHMIVTGLTQEAGKTTTLESLIKRSKKRAIVFRTKIGEKSFLEGTKIPPYFKDRSDWQFIQGLVEATIKEKLRSFERAKIIQIAKQTGGKSLLEFKKKVDERMEEKLSGFEKDILTNLQAYLELVLPKLQSINFSEKLELVDGLNIIDLERFSRDEEVQSLIIRSVTEEVLYNFKDVILVIPEAWKFLPQERGSPCKQIVVEFIRQGATNNNLIWIDAQNITAVDKEPLKQASVWILGYQSEENEVKKTIAQIPLPKKLKPTPDDIMTLKTGEFYLATREKTIKTYVQPFWLDDKRARDIALGKLKVSELDAPQAKKPFALAVKQPETITEKPSIDFSETTKRFNKELNEMRTDFFDKLQEVQGQFNKVYSEIFEIKNQPKQEINEETIIGKILQKIPTQPTQQVSAVGNKEELIKEILARVPSGGMKNYQVAPLEKLKKDFLEETKNKLLAVISSCDEKQKKMLKWMEQKGSYANKRDIFYNCFGSSATSGGAYQELVKKLTDMKQKEILKIDTHNRVYPILKARISELIEQYGATKEEVNQVYDHILMEILKGEIK